MANYGKMAPNSKSRRVQGWITFHLLSLKPDMVSALAFVPSSERIWQGKEAGFINFLPVCIIDVQLASNSELTLWQNVLRCVCIKFKMSRAAIIGKSFQ